jgi:hypothetical protein
MNVTKESDWNESQWFKEWLELARQNPAQNRDEPGWETDTSRPDNRPKPKESREFSPPFGEWNFSLRESIMLRLPRRHLMLAGR